MWRKKTDVREKWKWITAEAVQNYVLYSILFLEELSNNNTI